MSEPRNLRRSRCLTSHWQNGRFVLENYLTGGRIIGLPILAQLIHDFTEFTNSNDVKAVLQKSGADEELFKQLVTANMLVEQGSALADKEDQIDQWKWGHDARCFHYGTQHVAYTFDFDAIREQLEQKAIIDPPPSPFKEYPGRQMMLPQHSSDIDISLGTVLDNRRTVRDFSRRSLPINVMSTLLYRVWGKLRYYNDSQLDARIIKSSPSGGARHPIEVYVVAQRVEGVSPGIYHYSVQHHALTLLAEGLREERMVELFSGQTWVRDASALYFMTAVLPRSMWKYDHARAYRVVQLDAGHLGQTFHLVCTALGLGPFTTAALQDQEIESELGIDGVLEVSIYAAAAGYATA